jgi:hypothetical protein
MLGVAVYSENEFPLQIEAFKNQFAILKNPTLQ